MITTTTSQQCRRRRTTKGRGGEDRGKNVNVTINPTGETQPVLDRFEQIRTNEVEICHSPFENAPWDVNKDFEAVDIFELVVMGLVVIPQVLTVYPILFLLLLPPVTCNLMYISVMVPKSTESIPRTYLWKLHCITQAILCVPAAVVALFSLCISRLTMLIFGTAYCMLDDGGWERYHRNIDVIRPYCNGPPLYRYFSDCVVAVAGMVYRRGLTEFASSFALMFIVNPWIKYWITGNIYTSDLGERFVTQVGGPMEDMTADQMASSVMTYISTAKNRDVDRKYIHNPLLWCPHFPFPPPGKKRKFAVGLEHSTIACFVHTRHFQTKTSSHVTTCPGTENEPLCLSQSAKVPIYRVILWRNNPFHVYTGLVEACISKKKQSPEHPMWLISSHNKLAADPKVLLSTSWIDHFFDEFIPHLEYFIRSNELGKEAADAAMAVTHPASKCKQKKFWTDNLKDITELRLGGERYLDYH